MRIKEILVAHRPNVKTFGEREIMERRDLVKILVVNNGQRFISYRNVGSERWFTPEEVERVRKRIEDGSIIETVNRYA